MTTFRVSTSDVERWVDSGSLSRSHQYVCSPDLTNRKRKGNTLTARIYGTLPDPYRITVELTREGIASAYCSCPIGAGGHCKHVAAVLLTWKEEPQTFQEAGHAEDALEALDRSELIALIRQLLEAEPDLDWIVELALATRKGAFSMETLERQVRQAMSSFEQSVYPREGRRSLLQNLDAILAVAQENAFEERWPQAAQVARLLADEVVAQYEYLYDEDGHVAVFVGQVLSLIEEALPHLEDPTLRRGLLQTLFETYRKYIMMGGIGLGESSPDILLDHATREERREIIDWTRAAMPEGSPSTDDFSRSWRRQAFGGFLLELEAEDLDDDAYVARCLETGRVVDATERLLSIGRVEEAVAICREYDGYTLLSLAHVFDDHDASEAIVPVVLERAGDDGDHRLIEWLAGFYAEQGSYEEELRWYRVLFTLRPTVHRYQQVLACARRLDRFDDVRASLLDEVERKDNLELLTRLYLDDGEIAMAIETLERLRKQPSPQGYTWHAFPEQLMREVARAAESSLPDAAISLCQEILERKIDARGRGNYAEAAQLLKRIRHLYGTLGQEDEWKTYIAILREQHHRLPALKDELRKAGV